jgi:hypothetical protein
MNATCRDCGKPVHLTRVGCDCGAQVWYHDSVADSQACPGTGVHVQAAENTPWSTDPDTCRRVITALRALPGGDDSGDEEENAA